MKTEFDFINNIKSKYNLSFVGDDCAILPKDAKTDTVITADLLVEDVDFRLDWTTPELLGRKALAVSLSDVAAMGANSKYALLSLGVPEKLWKTQFLDGFNAGWHERASEFGVELVGGDVSRCPEALVIDSIVIGEVEKGRALRRSGARVGDSVFVTGHIGGSAAGLSLLIEGKRLGNCNETENALITKHLDPFPQIDVGISLNLLDIATAMLDISDGLSSDLGHLCTESRVGARIYQEMLPIEPLIRKAGFSDERALDMALHGGEDFALIFTGDAEKIGSSGLKNFTRIGDITSKTGTIELITENTSLILEQNGFRHY